MKKIILAFALLFTLSVQAQSDYIDGSVHVYGGYTNNLMGSSQYMTSFESPAFIGGAGLNIEFSVNEWFSWYIGADIELCAFKGGMEAGILPNIGTYFGYPNKPYVFLSLYPRFDVVGIGSQQYGDYLCVWTELDMGVGYEHHISGPHNIYGEIGVGFEMMLYQAEELRLNNPQEHNEVPLYLMVGYRYYISAE